MANLGHYELIREIGAGGMSTVYEAVDTRIGRRVALKVLTLPPYISQAQAAELVQRLQREARAAGRLNHPNIVTLYDVGETDGHHFLAMEFLNGPTLRERLKEGSLPPLEAAHILDGLAEALDAAHAEGILHRDIKPGNIILLPDGRVKLADFGVARQLDDATLTRAGAPVGSPAYMAPEQVHGEPASPASDRWALGVVLYEMLAGRPPFTAETISSVLHQVAYEPAPPLPGAMPQVQAVLEWALAKEPSARYRSSHALAAAFRAAAQSDAAPARAPLRRLESDVNRSLKPAETLPLAGLKGGEAAASPSWPRGSSSAQWSRAVPLVILLAGLLVLGYPALMGRSHRMTGHSGARHLRLSPHPVRSPAARTASRPPTLVQVTEVKPRGATATSPVSLHRSPAPVKTPKRQRAAPVVTAARAPSSVRHARLRRHLSRERRVARSTAAIVARSEVAPEADRQPRLAHARATVNREAQQESSAPRPVVTRSERSGDRTAAALNARAYRLQKQGRHAEAEPLLRAAVRRDPNHAYAQYNLGWSLLSQGKAREALAPLHRTAVQQPDRWEPQERLGQAYAQLGDAEKARAAYARARMLRSRSPRRKHGAATAGGRRRWRSRRDRGDKEPVQHLLPRSPAASSIPDDVGEPASGVQ